MRGRVNKYEIVIAFWHFGTLVPKAAINLRNRLPWARHHLSGNERARDTTEGDVKHEEPRQMANKHAYWPRSRIVLSCVR